jgi:hypothetical protein
MFAHRRADRNLDHLVGPGMIAAMPRPLDWVPFDYVFGRFRTRLEGLTDEEYLWAPAPGSWTVETTPDGHVRAHPPWPEPDPPPMTTIAWRMSHIGDVLGMDRNWEWLGRTPPPRRSDGDDDGDHPITAAGGIAYVTDRYDAWAALLGTLDDAELWRPLGPIARRYGDDLVIEFVLHVLDELIHHAAEVGVLRDLYRERSRLGS